MPLVTTYLIKRLFLGFFVLWGVLTIVFVLIRLGGNPAALYLPLDASFEEIEALRTQLGLDQPIWSQYARYLARVVTGDFGISLRHGEPALTVVLERVPATVRLAMAAVTVSVVVGVTLGIVSALRKGTWLDTSATVAALLGQSLPIFWTGLMLILVFSANLRWLPSSGAGTWQHLVMPAITLGAYSAALIARLTRSSLLDVLSLDYVRTARAKGVHEHRVIMFHALRNASLPVITIIALQIGNLLSGSVITETVFAYPGMGRVAYQAILARDFAVVQTFVVIMAIVSVAVNLLVDLAYGVLDPRVVYV